MLRELSSKFLPHSLILCDFLHYAVWTRTQYSIVSIHIRRLACLYITNA